MLTWKCLINQLWRVHCLVQSKLGAEILSWLLVSSEYHYLWVHWCTGCLSRWLISHHSWWGYWEISLLWIVLNGTLSCSGISGFQAKVFEHFQQKMVNGNWNIFWTYFQLGLRFASLASLGWGHSQLSRKFVCLGCRHFHQTFLSHFLKHLQTTVNTHCKC